MVSPRSRADGEAMARHSACGGAPHSVDPVAGMGAGVVGMLRGRGFLCFLVSKFLSFNVVWILGFRVSEIQKSLILCYQTIISCFLEDIDPISKIFKDITPDP